MSSSLLKKIGIIILNFGEKSLIDTIACLKSLQEIEYRGFEFQIYVVVYDQQGITLDQISHISTKISQPFPQVKIIQQTGNLGFARANNLGIQQAISDKCDYLLLLNNDTEVHFGFLENLFQYLQAHPQVGAVSPKIYFARGCEFHLSRYQDSELGKVIWYAGGKIDWQNIYTPHRGVDAVDVGQYDKVFQTDFITGCCTLIPVSVIQTVGHFNEDLFLYWEDIELSQRIQDAGYKLVYYPHAHIWHKNAGSSGVGSSLQDYYMTRNRLWFGMKYGSRRTKLALIRESFRHFFSGNSWVKKAIKDYYVGKMGQGSWQS